MANGSSSPLFISRVLDLQPHEALLLAALPGFLLFMGSVLMGIDHVSTPAEAMYSGAENISREVGYIPALNWSITYLLLFPLSSYFMISALQGMSRALEELHRRGMIRSNGQIVIDPKVSKSWILGTKSRTRLLWIFAVIIPISYSLGEWFWNNLLRLFGGGPTASYPDYDWGLSGLMLHWTNPQKCLNAAFDLLAFCAEGALIATSFAFFVILLDVRRALTKSADQMYIVPDLASEDVRRGFEVFSSPLQHMLLSALISYLICYLVRIEGVYMNTPGAASLTTFVSSLNLGQIVVVAIKDYKNLPAELLRLIDTGPYAFRGLLAWTISGLVSALSLIVVISTVRTAAAEARANALQFFVAGTTPLFGGRIDDERDKSKSMQVWPLAYIELNALVIAILVSFVTLYLYRIGLYFALLTVVVLLIKGSARIVKGVTNTG